MSSRWNAVIVGSSGALGREICAILQARGDRVIGLDRIPPADPAHAWIQTDIGDPNSVARSMEEVADRMPGIEVFIQAAGIMRTARFLDATDADMSEHLNVNVMGTFRVAQAAARLMRPQGGRIVLITSIHGQFGVAGRAAYAASKGAIAALARVMAVELAASRIRVNVLAPGATDGGMQPEPQSRKGWVATSPSARVATINEVARAAAWLTSDEASFITGQIIAVDGGASSTIHFQP